jgi:hypothetical protein
MIIVGFLVLFSHMLKQRKKYMLGDVKQKLNFVNRIEAMK